MTEPTLLEMEGYLAARLGWTMDPRYFKRMPVPLELVELIDLALKSGLEIRMVKTATGFLVEVDNGFRYGFLFEQKDGPLSVNVEPDWRFALIKALFQVEKERDNGAD